MLFNKNLVDEDLKRIKMANMPEHQRVLLEQEEEEDKKQHERSKLEKGDFPAIMIALFQTLAPYILIPLGFFALIAFILEKAFK